MLSSINIEQLFHSTWEFILKIPYICKPPVLNGVSDLNFAIGFSSASFHNFSPFGFHTDFKHSGWSLMFRGICDWWSESKNEYHRRWLLFLCTSYGCIKVWLYQIYLWLVIHKATISYDANRWLYNYFIRTLQYWSAEQISEQSRIHFPSHCASGHIISITSGLSWV